MQQFFEMADKWGASFRFFWVGKKRIRSAWRVSHYLYTLLHEDLYQFCIKFVRRFKIQKIFSTFGYK